MGLIEPPNKATGEIIYGGKNVLTMSQDDLRRFRWNEVAMIFQAAMNSLDPIRDCGKKHGRTNPRQGCRPQQAGSERVVQDFLRPLIFSEEVYKMYPFDSPVG